MAASSRLDHISIFAFLGFQILAIFMVVPNRYLEVTMYLDTYHQALKDRVFGQAGALRWSQRSHKDHFLSAVAYQLYQAASGLTSSYREVFSFTLSFVVNALVFGLVIDPTFSLALLASFVLGVGVNIAAGRHLDRYSELHKNEEIRLFAVIGRVWDNVILKNRSISQRFQRNYHRQKEQTLKATQKVYGFSEGVVFLASLVAWVPVIAMYAWVLFSGRYEASQIFAALILLPKQVEVIESLRAVSQLMTFWQMDKRAFNTVWSVSHIPEAELNSHIDWPRLLVGGSVYDSLEKVLSHLSMQTHGRIVVSGENGSGKSTLLALLHHHLTSSFLLPPHPALEISYDEVHRSSGQSVKAHLDYLKASPEKVILLDEWDANLDHRAFTVLNESIDELAQTRLVLEVRHLR